MNNPSGQAPAWVERAGWLLFGLWAGVSLFLPWRWSILMDEATFVRSLAPAPFWASVKEQFWAYWHLGRFYPVKMLANTLEWKLLPLDPVFFHRFHFFLALAALLLGWAAMQRRKGLFSLPLDYLGFFLASAALAKPILDIVQFLSVGESWAAFFFALGSFLMLRGNSLLARLVWILAAWSKEPMAGLFASSVLYQLSIWSSSAESRGKKIFFVALDCFLFLSLSFGAWYAMQQGPYLADYRLLSPAGLFSWVYSVARLSFFLLPLVLLALLGWLRNGEWRRDSWKNPGERSWSLFLLSFAAGYLFLVTPKGAAGYLQIPVGLAALLFLFPPAVKGIEAAKKLASSVMALFLVAWMAFGLFSIQRWSSYAHGINEVSLVFPELVRSSNPRLVIVHGAEMADILRRGAMDEGWTQVRVVENGDFHEENYRNYKGEVLLLEPTRYFDPLPEAYVLRLGEWVGGWKNVSASSPSYRAYFGSK